MAIARGNWQNKKANMFDTRKWGLKWNALLM
ncbi:hypothetical protein LMG29542_04231 [Paraburkholderia humisilvae]|uniref:Uncharacterized protein n=1 Tax=Paraburkholderia humisilvae TaxID=627669 RepID=A0A6J5E891_9BURK|nr:hypothetical protein LMG29542_04231 [Paraburkholderia humisilvae]